MMSIQIVSRSKKKQAVMIIIHIMQNNTCVSYTRHLQFIDEDGCYHGWNLDHNEIIKWREVMTTPNR